LVVNNATQQKASSLRNELGVNVDFESDLCIVGGGIVGLATALQALKKRPGIRLAVLEKEAAIGRHQTDTTAASSTPAFTTSQAP